MQPVLCGTARKILKTLKKMPPSNQSIATVNTLTSISPLIIIIIIIIIINRSTDEDSAI